MRRPRAADPDEEALGSHWTGEFEGFGTVEFDVSLDAVDYNARR
jgi:hypothetical protein